MDDFAYGDRRGWVQYEESNQNNQNPADETSLSSSNNDQNFNDIYERDGTNDGCLLTPGIFAPNMTSQLPVQQIGNHEPWLCQDQQHQGLNNFFEQQNFEFSSIGSNHLDQWLVDVHGALVYSPIPENTLIGGLQPPPDYIPNMALNSTDGFQQTLGLLGETLSLGQSTISPSPGVPPVWPVSLELPVTNEASLGRLEGTTGTASSLAISSPYSSNSSGPRWSTSMSAASPETPATASVSSQLDPRPSTSPRETRPDVLLPRLFQCSECKRTFPKKFELTKHEKTHTRPFTCPLRPRCTVTSAEKRGINRHLWTDHKDYARQHKIPSEERRCPYPGCDTVGRKDNIKRHIRKKHG